MTSGQRSTILYPVMMIGVAIVAAIAAAMSMTGAEADHDPGGSGIDIFAFDMNPAGNTATHVDTIDECVALANVGDTAVVDLVVDQVPVDGVIGIETNVLYNPGIVHVTAVQGNLLLAASGSPAMFSFGESVPDTNGNFRIAFQDASPNYESGEGVIVRLTFQAVGTGKAILSAEDQDFGIPHPNIFSPDTSTYPVSNNLGGTIAVGVPCSSGADVAASGAAVSSPASASLGTPFNVTVTGSAQNNGPSSPANTDVTVTLSLPPDCAASSGSQRVLQDQLLATGSPLAINETFSVTCASPSFHAFTGVIAVALDDSGITDMVSANNQSSSSPSTTAITAIADLAVTSVTVTTAQTTPTPMAGASLDLIGTISVRNNGPAGPIAVSGQAVPSFPSDCTLWSLNNPQPFSVSVPALQTVNVQVHYHVRCTAYGNHTLGVSATVSAQDIHVSDAAGNNSNSGSASFPFKVAYCGPDPNPNGMHPSPQLLALILQLTASGTPVPAEFRMLIDCQFAMTFKDMANTPNDDCPVAIPEKPCSVSFPMSLELIGGSPPSRATARLNPIGIEFAPLELDWASDAEVPNGTISGSANFGIRTDAGLLPNNIECSIDANFPLTVGREGGIKGNVPESNLGADLSNPHVWPNDLNAEKALVEASLKNPITGAPAVTLWSRTIVPLRVGGLSIDMNILTWKITDPTFILLTGAGWVIVPFPGDVVNPDAPGTIGGNPDADDPPPLLYPMNYCTPHYVTLTFNGMAGSTVFLSCTAVADPFGWVLVDPDATNVTGDDGQRSDTSTCSLDPDGDGLGLNSETYWGTNPVLADTDFDGVPDGIDNCKTASNASQADHDSDGIGDICDPDADGDGVLNANDPCPMTEVGAAIDSNGCSRSQVDFDEDDWCNPGAPSGGPVPCQPTDNCPNVYNPDQANADGDDFGDACEQPNCLTVVNNWTVPEGDADCDGYADTTVFFPRASEQTIGTLANQKCSLTPATHDEPLPDAWPPDFNDNQIVNVGDIVAFNIVFGQQTTNPPVTFAGTSTPVARWDLNGSGLVNVSDVLQLNPFMFKRCTP